MTWIPRFTILILISILRESGKDVNTDHVMQPDHPPHPRQAYLLPLGLYIFRSRTYLIYLMVNSIIFSKSHSLASRKEHSSQGMLPIYDGTRSSYLGRGRHAVTSVQGYFLDRCN